MRRFLARAAAAALCAISLAGCVDSAGPILPDAQPLLGERLNLQLFSLRNGHAYDPERATFIWNGKFYRHAGGSLRDVRGFSVHPFEGGDFIVQSTPARHPQLREYALMRKLTDGVYQVIAIDEADADEPTREANCTHPGGTACRIETREQIAAFARATAARRSHEGGIAILLEEPAKRRR